MIKDFKNYNEIKESVGQVRGERIDTKDLTLFYFNKDSEETYNYSDGKDTVELSVYDMDDNFLQWAIVPPPYEMYDKVSPNKIILKPGNDLRLFGFQRGQYRVVYEFFRNSLGGFNDNKLFIEEISPSRKEIRVLPVKTTDENNNIQFNSDFVNFGRNGILTKSFARLFGNKLNTYTAKDFFSDVESSEYEELSAKFTTLVGETINQVYNNAKKEAKDILQYEDQQRLSSVAEKVFTIVFGEGFDQSGTTMRVYIRWEEFIKTLVFYSPSNRSADFYINFGNSKNYFIVNWAQDSVKYPEYPNSIVLKLYEPLPQDFKENDQLWVSKKITYSIIEKAFLLEAEREEDYLILEPANWDINVAGITGRSTGYETWDTLLSTYPSTSQALLDEFISASNPEVGDISLNINYGDYSEFVHFGSAEERLANFKYKMELIDAYNEEILKVRNTSSSGSAIASSSIGNYENKKRVLVNGLDSYERHLYYSSGSQYSGSTITGKYLTNAINEWPKQNKTKPFILYRLTSSNVTSWYEDQLTIAQEYDKDNIYNFVSNIPDYLTVDENNGDYLAFIYMMGQYFDMFWAYTKHLTKIHNRDESIFEGMAKDLTYHVAKSLGFDLFNGRDNSELWRYAFGYDATGSYYVGSVSGSSGDKYQYMSHENVSKEIWRRILNNLSYLLKTKGTERSIRALLACYGIPTSLLTIREYGGPDPRDYSEIDQKSSYIFDDFVYALNLEGSQSISFSWSDLTQSKKPDTIEFRFASAPTLYDSISSVGLGRGKPTQSLVSADDWAIRLLDSGSGYGAVEFIITNGATVSSIKTDKYRYYDNEFNSVMVRYSASAAANQLQLFVKKAESDRIIWHSSANLTTNANILTSWTNTSTLYIGGDAGYTWGVQFTGSLQEFKLYQSALSESAFDNHVRWPKSYNSNTPTRTYYDLVLRYSLDNPVNHATTTTVSDIKANQSWTTVGTATNFGSHISYSPRTEEFAALTIQMGGGRYINTKIRLEDNEIEYGHLSVAKRVEKSSFDRAPLDSPKLGIYFSPIESINRDIIATYAGLDLSGYIGDPRDRFNDSYDDLDELSLAYWRKYKSRPDFNKFIRVLKHYDASFFNQLRSLIPARAKPVIGVLIEPTILERHKIKWRDLVHERIDKETNIYVNNYCTMSSTLPKYESEILQIDPTYEGAFEEYNSAINFAFEDSIIYDGYIEMIHPIQDMFPSGSWTSEARSLRNRLYYAGTLNTTETSIDGKEPVEVFYTNPNRLMTTDMGPSKILVE